MDSVRLNRLRKVSEFLVDVVDEGSTAMDEDLKNLNFRYILLVN